MPNDTDFSTDRLRLILTNALRDLDDVEGGCDEQTKIAAARRRVRQVDRLMTARLIAISMVPA